MIIRISLCYLPLPLNDLEWVLVAIPELRNIRYIMNLQSYSGRREENQDHKKAEIIKHIRELNQDEWLAWFREPSPE